MYTEIHNSFNTSGLFYSSISVERIFRLNQKSSLTELLVSYKKLVDVLPIAKSTYLL